MTLSRFGNTGTVLVQLKKWLRLTNSLLNNEFSLKPPIKLKSNTHFIRDGGLSVKHELRDHSLGVVSVTLSADGSRLASRWVQHSGQVVNNSFLVDQITYLLI